MRPLSEHEVLRDYRLPNWARWGRQDSCRPDPEACGANICADFDPNKDGEPGWGDDDASYDPIPPIDHRDADYLDGFLFQLMRRQQEQFAVIKLHYVRRRRQPLDALDAAIRALRDLIEANRATVGRMRSLGAP